MKSGAVKITLLFLIKLQLLFLAGYVLTRIIPYLGFFPYGGVIQSFKLPALIYSLANFDGAHYILIALRGYAQYEQAFFPLYPLLMHVVGGFLAYNYLLAGLLISNAAFLAGLFFFVRLTSQNADKKKVNLWPLLMLLAFPTSFFFHTVYTEGLFFLFFTSSLYYTKERKYFYAAVLAALASSTRLIGVLLVIPLAIMLWHNTHIHKKIFSVHYLILLIPFLGIGTYMIYLWRTTGDPLFFFNSQPAFGANRSTQLILLPQVYFRYFKIFFFAHHDIAYRVALVECLSFTTVVLMSLIELVRQAKKQNHFLLSVGLVSLVNILLPTLTGTFSSIPRYALFSFSVYFFLASLTKSLRIGVILTLFLLQCILFGFFLQGYFIG